MIFSLRYRSLALSLSALLLCPLAAHSQKYQGRELVEARLLADVAAVAPGQPFTAGLLLEMVPGWHTYWQFPGDAGIPTEIKWQLPPGWSWGTEGLWDEHRHFQEIVDALDRSLSLVSAPDPTHAKWLEAEAKGLAHRNHPAMPTFTAPTCPS